MPVEILMPALSPTMKKGKLIKWCVAVNDSVGIGDIVAEVETDKATMEVEAFEEGKIGKILVEAGTADVMVNAPMAIILLDGETISDLKDFSSSVVEEKAVENVDNSHDEKKIKESVTAVNKEVKASVEQRIKASPLAKRIAQEHNIDIAQVKVGSGPYGRIVKEDILNLINAPDNVQAVRGSFSDVSTMRGVIAERLVFSKQNIPHFYLTVDCNVGKLLEIRKQVNNEGCQITVNDFIVKATALALKKFPDVNSSWQGQKIEHYPTVDVAVAVSLDEGLITPIVTQADTKSLQTLSTEVKSLIRRAKAGKLSSHEYQGGGITISNLGMFGIKDFIAIINPPQSSILAVGKAEKRPIIQDDAIAIATMMTMTLSVDHRVVDGALGAQFLNEIKNFLENPISILIS